jgi:hypothetical protein
MELNAGYLKHIGANALVWTGILAVALTLYSGDYTLAIFLVAIIAFNIMVSFGLHLLSITPPQMGSVVKSPGREEVAFTFSPVAYPKSFDNETRDFHSEFIQFDINKAGDLIFRAHMDRPSLKGLRDALQSALDGKIALHAHAPATAPTPAKQGRKKKN